MDLGKSGGSGIFAMKLADTDKEGDLCDHGTVPYLDCSGYTILHMWKEKTELHAHYTNDNFLTLIL